MGKKDTATPTTEERLPSPAPRVPSLLEQVARGRLSIPRRYGEQRRFFRFLKRAAVDDRLRESMLRLQEHVMLAFVRGAEKRTGGLVAALAGVEGQEGTSFLSLMLSLSLGDCSHRRVALLDGRFCGQRFGTLSEMLGLSANSVTVHKGSNAIQGYYNESQPNVYFLRPGGVEHGLQFFSDPGLQLFLSDLRSHFDFVIVDMPPLLKETSNVFLAPLVDRFYIVARSGITRRADLKRSREVIEETGSSAAGVILNQQKAPVWSKFFWRDFFF